MIYTLDELKAEFKRLGYIWPKFHAIGVRSKADAINQFDDYIYLVNGETMHIFTGTTNPGTYWHQNYDKAKGGVALLVPGQYVDAWILGKHRGMYEAWVQAKPVKVYRDGDKDNKSEKTEVIQSGIFGINWHRASEKWTSKLVDKFSAGCVVQNDPKNYAIFIDLSKKSGQKFFTGTILDEFTPQS